MKIGFINFGNKQSPAISLTFNGRPVGDSVKHRSWVLAREEAQLYFDGKRGDVRLTYSLDHQSLLPVM